MNLLLIIAARCNAACGHCSQSYGPKRSETLALEDIFRLMDEAAAIDDGAPLEFDITGGEPFMDFERLQKVIAYGARLGGSVSCTTNAYWARSSEIANDRLAILREAGLECLAVSVSRFHQKFVPLVRARWALQAAEHLGIHTELKGALTTSDLRVGAVEAWRSVLDADDVHMFPVLPQLREGAELAEAEFYRVPGLPDQTCPGETVAVDFNGLAMSCCAPRSNDPFLVIGNAHSMPLKEIRKNFLEQGQQRVLRTVGPIHFARAAQRAGYGHLLRQAYAGPCDLCLHVRSDATLRKIAEHEAASF